MHVDSKSKKIRSITVNDEWYSKVIDDERSKIVQRTIQNDQINIFGLEDILDIFSPLKLEWSSRRTFKSWWIGRRV